MCPLYVSGLIGPGDRKAGAAAWPFTARVQQGERMGRIGRSLSKIAHYPKPSIARGVV
jgi:hypothetical protein